LVRLLGEALVLVLTLLLIYGAWGMIDLTAFDTYTALGISVRWLYSALFVGGALWLLGSIVEMSRHFREIVR
jgi:TRAP-type C4-dicarboxylate transport system permease small subunit